MTSLSHAALMELNPAMRERLDREMSEMRAETTPASWIERLGNFWASLYATPMPGPRTYL